MAIRGTNKSSKNEAGIILVMANTAQRLAASTFKDCVQANSRLAAAITTISANIISTLLYLIFPTHYRGVSIK